MGDADRDGTFDDFLAAAAATELVWAPAGEDPGVHVTRPGRPALAVSFSGAYTVDGVVSGLGADGRPVEDLQLRNPAITAGLGADCVQVAWAGQEHRLDVGAALDGLGSSN